MKMTFKGWCDLGYWTSAALVIISSVSKNLPLMIVAAGGMWFTWTMATIEDYKEQEKADEVPSCPI